MVTFTTYVVRAFCTSGGTFLCVGRDFVVMIPTLDAQFCTSGGTASATSAMVYTILVQVSFVAQFASKFVSIPSSNSSFVQYSTSVMYDTVIFDILYCQINIP
jgi:hypothetical protein